jgi:hypothetical protein
MSTVIGRSALSSGEPPLDARLCVETGAELARRRIALGLTIEQVSEKLLLSTRQVKALEEVEFAAFHNPAFHVNALRKYARLAELDDASIERIAASLPKPDPAAAGVEAGVAAPPDGRSLHRAGVIGGALVIVIAAAAGGYGVWTRSAPRSTAAALNGAAKDAPAPAVLPSTPFGSARVVEPAVVAASTMGDFTRPDMITGTTPLLFGTLRVAHPTWIFVRDADGAVIERSLAAAESFEFETQPTYLAVGSVDAELVIGTTPVDLSRFVANGQLRIRAGDFDALVQGASPIPAPTAATSSR